MWTTYKGEFQLFHNYLHFASTEANEQLPDSSACLQYLSLSDATVLTFLVPLTTAVAGFFFLGEAFQRKEAFAGGEPRYTLTDRKSTLIFFCSVKFSRSSTYCSTRGHLRASHGQCESCA